VKKPPFFDSRSRTTLQSLVPAGTPNAAAVGSRPEQAIDEIERTGQDGSVASELKVANTTDDPAAALGRNALTGAGQVRELAGDGGRVEPSTAPCRHGPRDRVRAVLETSPAGVATSREQEHRQITAKDAQRRARHRAHRVPGREREHEEGAALQGLYRASSSRSA